MRDAVLWLVLCAFAGRSGGESSSLCRDGKLNSLNDRYVCCDRDCPSCDTVQCALRNHRCCPNSLAGSPKVCERPHQTSCTFARSTELTSAELYRSGEFCAAGIRVNRNAHAVCCSRECAGGCEKACAAGQTSCCASQIIRGDTCDGPRDVDCFLPRPEVDFSGFRGKEAAKPAAEPRQRARRTTRRNIVDVVVAGDRIQALGVLACARSVFASTLQPERVVLHVIVDEPAKLEVHEALRCMFRLEHRQPRRYRVYSFNLLQLKRNITIRAPTNSLKGNLAAGPNFARFYLTRILSRTVEKVVYLDADTIVVKDLAYLYDTSLTPDTPSSWTVAAVARPYKTLCGSFINCKSPEAMLLLQSQNLSKPETQLDAFNAGVMVIHLGRWRQQRMTEKVEYWIAWNTDLPLYKLGSNPPLVLAVRDEFQRLDSRWNCQRGHECWDTDAGILHWSGARKPWHLAFERDRVEWLRYLESGQAADGTNLTRSLRNCHVSSPGIPSLGSRPAYASRDHERQEQHDHSEMFSEQPLLGDAALKEKQRRVASLAEARVKVATRLVANGRGPSRGRSAKGNAADWARRDTAVLAALERSLDRARPSTARELVVNLRAQVAQMAEKHQRCDCIGLAILGGRLHIDVAQYGRGRPCGVVPSEAVSNSIAFLSAVFNDVELDDAYVVLCCDRQGPEEWDLPFFTHLKKTQKEPGILVPGPRQLTLPCGLDSFGDQMEPQSRREAMARYRSRQPALESTETVRLSKFVGSTQLDHVDMSLRVAEWSQREAELFKCANPPHADRLFYPNRANHTGWKKRSKRAGWRGKLEPHFSCDDADSRAMLEAVSVTLEQATLRGFLVDARLTHAARPSPTQMDEGYCYNATRNHSPGRLLKYVKHILRNGAGTSRNFPHILGTFVAYRYVLSMPSDERDVSLAASLWGVGAAVLVWGRPALEWYEPALRNGETHLEVDANSVADVARLLSLNDVSAIYLAWVARGVYERYLCAKCVAEQWKTTIRLYRERFAFEQADLGKMLKDLGVTLMRHDITTPCQLGEPCFGGL